MNLLITDIEEKATIAAFSIPLSYRFWEGILVYTLISLLCFNKLALSRPGAIC